MRKKCLETIYQVAKLDKRVVFIGSDLGPGVLNSMKNEMPDRFFMEGISEQHIIGMSAGLAFDGLLPFVNTISTFLTRRCFEQIVRSMFTRFTCKISWQRRRFGICSSWSDTSSNR